MAGLGFGGRPGRRGRWWGATGRAARRRDRPLGRRRRFAARDEIAALRGRGIRSSAPSRQDRSDTELAIAALRLERTGVVVVGARRSADRSRARQPRPAAMPPAGGARSCDGRSRVSLIRTPDVDEAAVSPRGAHRRHGHCCRWAPLWKRDHAGPRAATPLPPGGPWHPIRTSPAARSSCSTASCSSWNPLQL
jgi:hypothetical protein